MTSAILLSFLLAFGLSLAMVPLCRYASVRFGYVAKPREDRWHRRQVALFGGVGIAATVFLCSPFLGVAREIPVLLGCAAAIFLVGLVDDLITLKPSTKLIAQLALASVLLFFDFHLNWLHSATLDSLLTLLWVVGLTNAFNLLDNMDGLCGGIAIIVGSALLLDLLPGSSGAIAHGESLYLALILGATAGFLVYNLHPASIFMGDGGSLLLGFSFAAVTLNGGRDAPGRHDILSIVAAPVLVLLIPIFDTTLVTISRLVTGRSASQGGRDHTSHRLVAIGLSERRAVVLLWALAATGGAIGIAFEYVNRTWASMAAFAFLVGMVLFAAYLAGIRVYDDGDGRVRQGAMTPILVEFMYKRRVAEVILDFCLVSACYYIAYRLRFEDPVDFMRNFVSFSTSMPVVIAVQMVAFFAVGVYRGVWRHFGMADTLVIARGVVAGVVASQLVILYVYRFFSYSRSVFAIYGVLLLIAVTLSRASFRLVSEFLHRQRRSGKRVAIYGAGDGGAMVLPQIRNLGDGYLSVLGFIDDDPARAGNRVGGYPVLGNFSSLTLLVKTRSVDLVVIGAQQLAPERLHNLEVLCSDNGVGLTRLRVGFEDLVRVEDDERPPTTSSSVVEFKPRS